MVRRRRAFLDRGHFQPLADALVDVLARHTPTAPVLVDAGCGEGWYSRSWPDRLPGASVWAVDIAKVAVRAAARRSDRVHYAVASVYDLPLPDAGADAVVSVFAPIHTAEFDRVLRPGGALVVVAPGPRHLWQLKEQLFDPPEEHPDAVPLPDPVEWRRLHYAMPVRGPGAVGDLLGMTPYAWYVDPGVRAAAEDLAGLDVEADFLLGCWIRV